MKPIVIALALMLLPTPAAAEPVRSLAQLPPIVQEHIRDMERGCGADATPDYRLSEIVHVHPLSGPRTRDYIVDEGRFRCRSAGGFTHHGFCGATGSCGFAVYLQRGREWTRVSTPCSDLAVGWYTIRRPGKKTVLVIQRRCYGGACRGPHSYVLRITRDAVTEKEIR